MGDAIDDVTGLEDEEESDEVVGAVLDELGLDLGMAMGEAPTGIGIAGGKALGGERERGRVAQAVGGLGGGGGGEGEDDDLQARLDSLRKD